jgi:ADP-ribose pyrophosphatase YjhB (NUDIX family)
MNQKHVYGGNEIDIYSIEIGSSEIEQAVSKLDTVAVLPYKLNRDKTLINSVYLVKFSNLYSSKQEISALTETCEEEKDETYLDCALRGLYEEIGLKIQQDIESRVGYIGQIKFNKYFNKSITCYCVDISGMKVPDTPGKKDDETDNQSIHKFKVKDIMNDMIVEDALTMSLIQMLLKTQKNKWANE